MRILPVLLAFLPATACFSLGEWEFPALFLPLEDVEDWGSEEIQLPPEFAPDLPSGEEHLLFAPGMFEAGSEELWSHVFVMRLDEVPPGRERLEEILELYYDGLIATVGESRGIDVGDDPASVRVEEIEPNELEEEVRNFEAKIELIDAFVTGQPVSLQMRILTAPAESGSFGAFLASPQPLEHPVWIRLFRAFTTLVSTHFPEES